jgi:hypothetical protein
LRREGEARAADSGSDGGGAQESARGRSSSGRHCE